MKKKMITYEGICILVIVAAFVLTLFAGGCVRQDIFQVRGTLTTRAINSNTTMYGKQVNQFFNSHIQEAASLASCVALFNRGDNAQLNQLLRNHNNEFDRVGIIDIRGNYICGDQLSFPDIANENYYESLNHGMSLVAPGIFQDISGENVFYFFAPVVQGSSVQMIVVGVVETANLVHSFDTTEFIGSGCVCLMDQDGEYLLGDSSFEEMLGSKESNHFSHIGGAASGALEKSFKKGEKKSISYSYASVKYNAVYVPLVIQNWYLAVTIPENEDAIQGNVLSGKTKILLWLSLLLLLTAVFSFVSLVWQMWKLKRENGRYELLQRCDGAVSFELSFKPHVLKFYGDLRRMVGTDPGDLYGEEVYDIYDWIHEDDSSLRGSLHQFFDSDQNMFSTEIRIRHIKGNYSWYRIVGIMQRDILHKKKSYFVGKIMNVDEEIAAEKDLVQRAENDLLTGVLNKTTMEKMVSLKLKNCGNQYVIFYMVDLDNFKNVNDTLGHIYGDQAIVETAQALNKVFADQDCIGRLGGDEFAVCVTYQAFDEQNLRDFIEKKADKICQVNRRTYTDGASEVSITSSVGIAYAPDMGRSFEELYTKADRALYYSKENGKNRYHIYSEGDN